MQAIRQRILITGASAGIGAELARQFAAKGRSLALCARRLPALEKLRDEHPNAKVLVKQLDVTDPDAVSTVFHEFAAELGSLDRVIVNAAISAGRPIGTGGTAENRETVATNFLGALAQCEAALEIFRKQNAGHLVVVSSMAALRGLPGAVTTYAATKAVSNLAEGIRVDVVNTPIKVTTILPGYIRSEMNPNPGRMISDTVPAVRAMLTAIEREPRRAYVPPWPWRALALVLRHLSDRVLKKST